MVLKFPPNFPRAFPGPKIKQNNLIPPTSLCRRREKLTSLRRVSEQDPSSCKPRILEEFSEMVSSQNFKKNLQGLQSCGLGPQNSAERSGFCEAFRQRAFYSEAPVRFGLVTVWGWNGSSGSGFRFWRLLRKSGFTVFQYSSTGRDGSGSGFGSWKTVLAVPVPLSVLGKNVRFRRFRFPVPVRFLSHPVFTM